MRKFARWLLRWIRVFQWRVQRMRVIAQGRVCEKAQPLEDHGKMGRLLVVAPHADDEFVGCLEVLKRYPKRTDVYCVCMTGYEQTEENARMRAEEFQKSSQMYGFTPWYGLDHDWKKQLRNMLEEHAYDAVFLPSLIDWHWEHRDVTSAMLEILKAAGYRGDILFYQVSVPILTEAVNCGSPITGKKWREFPKVYPSQLYMPIKRFALADTIPIWHGHPIEPYVRIGAEQIGDLLHNYKRLDTEKLNELYASINDLLAVRRCCMPYYRMLFENIRL